MNILYLFDKFQYISHLPNILLNILDISQSRASDRNIERRLGRALRKPEFNIFKSVLIKLALDLKLIMFKK